ncbi:TonB-dependent receptor [Flavobacterium agricola]|uniref:TonB-dependent receptor n=1 Tax=Flavobacterium agricola TaxID=2870839 RepID=A0ABY6M2V5_9FLAO|nr:TonB-dependent receptor [Flavobacterium agricola]UYW01491.1 TonB-dependent receptor [Flavobacterium agricola]
MTMFSNIPSQKDMFMLTWPGVTTNYVDVNVEDKYYLSDNWSVKALAGLGFHNNQLKNELGFESLQIFYPDLTKNKNRLLKRFSGTVQYQPENWMASVTLGYGERAPSISEGYGFYLFNSFDRFDYIGNPNLKNEKSTSIAVNVGYTAGKWAAKLTASAFYLNDYIIGKPDPNLSTMTINAAGVKIYDQLTYATIYNLALDFNYNFFRYLAFKNKFVYARGTGQGNINLPTMQPFTYQSAFVFSNNGYGAMVEVKGATKQTKINTDFGEMPLPSYAILNASVSKDFYFANKQLVVKVGAENILDKKYTTFSDWNRIPQMGRNVFINTIINF